MLDISEAKRGLALLEASGMKKINFAGGEPFLYEKYLGDLCNFCKIDLKLESVSIVSNGTKVTEKWFQKYGQYVDIFAVSCDSFNEDTNIRIGRGDGYNVKRLKQIARWCKDYNVMMKMNTVVCRYNFDEDMVSQILEIAPFRWKCFQVLVQPGENSGFDRNGLATKRDATPFKISDEEFEVFCNRHKHISSFVAEPNRLMAASYLILDEYMCFLDKEKDFQSQSILDVGVQKALADVHWDTSAFVERGGEYEWTNRESQGSKETSGCGSGGGGKLEW
jgi:radical S-adenosyl methionine domain-containing protein 2